MGNTKKKCNKCKYCISGHHCIHPKRKNQYDCWNKELFEPKDSISHLYEKKSNGEWK